ncbi:MAG: hypothetical protein D6723_09565 [Acidobacteria bacterium]|nr:MAG: hypothetical protein D6723_09565 [Acidobacteriota bacterium]
MVQRLPFREMATEARPARQRSSMRWGLIDRRFVDGHMMPPTPGILPLASLGAKAPYDAESLRL